MRVQNRARHTLQRGISLVEVMIALTIGLVLLIGIGQYFSGMRQTAKSAEQMSAVQNQQRMAMYFLHTAVSGAGYNPDPLNKTSDAQYPAGGVFTLAGQTVFGTGSISSTAATLTVRFTATTGGAEQGCSANLTAGDTYTDVFSVSGGFLTCSETDNTTGTTTSIKLVGDATTGVSGMTIRYGVDTSSSGSVSQYMGASDVTSGSYWGSIKTVEVTLIFVDPLAGQVGHNATSTPTVQLIETIPYMANI